MTEIRNYLSNIKSQGGDKNLYEHISNVLGKMLLDNTSNAYDGFEEYSHDVKLTGFNYKNDTNFDHKPRMRETFSEVQPWADKTLTNFEKPNVGTDEDPQEPGQTGYVPNLVEEMRKFEWAGIYFGEEETLQLQRSLTKLSHSRRPKTLRLWGKILGSEKDYYVAEGEEVQPLGEEEPIPEAEPRGAGVNKFTYFVTSGPLDEWVELPLITPKHVVQARRVKHILTGNLNAKIITNPFFDGEERHYLKAQIVRISYTTGIVPRGLYKKVGEGEEAEETREIELAEAETFKFPTLEESVSLNSWVHINTNILKEGKIAHSEPTEAQAAEEGFDQEKWLAQRKVQDPFEDVLKPLARDRAPEGYRRAWTVRTYADPITYETVAKVPAKVNYAVVVLKSNVWPGLTIAISDNSQQSIYVGYGFKAKLEPYFPTFTKNVFADPEDPVEQPEPNPTNLPPPVQENQGDEAQAGGDEPDDGANE